MEKALFILLFFHYKRVLTCVAIETRPVISSVVDNVRIVRKLPVSVVDAFSLTEVQFLVHAQ